MRFRDTEFSVQTTYAGVEHEYRFALSLDGQTCFPTVFVQGGEQYKAALEDVPPEIVEAVLDNTGLQVIEP